MKDAAASMLHATRGTELRQLARERCKLLAVWETLYALVVATRRLEEAVAYRSTIVGELQKPKSDRPESVDVDESCCR